MAVIKFTMIMITELPLRCSGDDPWHVQHFSLCLAHHWLWCRLYSSGTSLYPQTINHSNQQHKERSMWSSHTPQTSISNLGLYSTINLSPAQIILFWSQLANSTTLPLHHKHNFVQFLLLSLCFGIPLLTFFLSTGQYLGSGLIDMWRISPVFQVTRFHRVLWY